MPQRHALAVARQDRLVEPERGEGHRLADGQRQPGEHDRLGGQHRAAARRRGERDLDQPGAVLGAERQHASTLTAITAYSRLMTPGISGSGRGPRQGAFVNAKATTALTTIGVTTATSRDQKVERTERTLVHSDPSRS